VGVGIYGPGKNVFALGINNFIGLAFFAGLSVPFWFTPHFDVGTGQIVSGAIAWGAQGSVINVIGNIFQAILSTGMAVTAILGIILDNLLPGATRAERGLEAWERDASEEAWEEAEAQWAAMEEGEMRPV
jgi:hypothetical protein